MREKVAKGQGCVLHVPSRYQIANIFTKGLPLQLFDGFWDIHYLIDIQYQHTKHIEIDIHFVREKVAKGQVRVLHVYLANK